jgi:hypothetical protein
VLSVVHTGVTVVLIFPVDLLRRKGKSSLSKQYVHMSLIAVILILAVDLLKTGWRGGGGVELLVYFIADFPSSVTAVCRYAKLHITPRMC